MQFQDSGENSNKTINPKEYSVMQWQMKACNVTTNIKVKIYFTFPELGARKHLVWNFHVDEFAKRRYGVVLGRDILT